jgi:anti-sigma regulatory factor (Ser/Thr protein kinase)
MEEMRRNPAWIIPSWTSFLAPHAAAGRPARGIGEPAWFGRSEDELVECGRHEALLNLAFSDASAFTLLCPYDAAALPGPVLEEAFHNHPLVGDAAQMTPNDRFRSGVPTWLTTPLPAAPSTAQVLTIHGGVVGAVRRRVAEVAAAAGLPPSRVDDLLVAVGEAASNTVRHGGGAGEIALWQDGSVFLCEVRDRGRIADPLAGRRLPPVDQIGGRGLWLMNQLCDLVQIRALPEGQAIRLHITP